jgi:hypothetical protein
LKNLGSTAAQDKNAPFNLIENLNMTEDNRWHNGFKGIIPTTWQTVDKQSSLWMQMTSVVKTGNEWVDFYLSPDLVPKVPAEIAKLLEVARGAMIYGWYFYPLCTLGAEQCWRVFEAAVRLRCQQLGISIKRTGRNGRELDTSLSENVDALVTCKQIPKLDKGRWDAVRRLRNSTSHPSQQMILDPGQAQGILDLTVGVLNDLFA